MTLHPLYGNQLPQDWDLSVVDSIKAPDKSSCVAGPFGSNIASKYFVEDGVPVIRGSNLREDLTRFVPEGFVFVSEERAKKYLPQHVRAGDLVFTCWGTIGQVALIPSDGPYSEYVISNKQLKLRPNPEIAEPVYLFYYFASPAMVEHIRGRAIGTAVPGINLGILKSLPVVLPPLATQKRIAVALAAYDELIENNLRRIKILEDMAQAIFREWFVELRIPGHEQFETAVHRIPDGWSEAPIGQVADVVRGRSYRKAEVPDSGGLPFLNLKCINRGGGFRRSGIKRYTGPFKPAQETRPGDIVVSVTDMTQERNIIARAARVPTLSEDTGVISLDLVRVVPKNIDRNYLYGVLRYSSFPDEVKNYANGANVLHLSPKRIAEYLIRVPPGPIQTQYFERTEPMYQIADRLDLLNENLRLTRDLLLPKLISGEIDVSELDIDTSWLAS